MGFFGNARLGAGMVLVAGLLAACGGGGSEAPSAPPAPPASSDPTSLTVTASSDVAFEGDGPITLASTPGKNSAIIWSTSPPIGSLSGSTGTTVTFTPPPLNTLATDTAVVITAASAGLTSGTVTIPIFRSMLSVPPSGITGNSTAGQSTTLQLVATPNVQITGTLYAKVSDPEAC